MSTAVIWSESKPEVEFQYDGRLVEFSGMSSQSHIAGCKNSIRHIENRFPPYFILFCFLDAFWALTSGGFHIVSDTLVSYALISGLTERSSATIPSLWFAKRELGLYGSLFAVPNVTVHQPITMLLNDGPSRVTFMCSLRD